MQNRYNACFNALEQFTHCSKEIRKLITTTTGIIDYQREMSTRHSNMETEDVVELDLRRTLVIMRKSMHCRISEDVVTVSYASTNSLICFLYDNSYYYHFKFYNFCSGINYI